MRRVFRKGELKFTLLLADCLQVLPDLDPHHLVCSDPPYGIGYDGGVSQRGSQCLGAIQGDFVPFDPRPWLHFKDVLLWGANNYSRRLPEKGAWYFWDKVVRNNLHVRIAEAEYAWHLCGTKPRGFRMLWSGAYRPKYEVRRSVHPTQKPVSLMCWCLDRFAGLKGKVVIDPYMGSGSTLLACLKRGVSSVGIEKDRRYFDVAVQRVERALGSGSFGL